MPSPDDDLARAARDADPALVRQISAAAQGEHPYQALEAVAVPALQAGTDREDILLACYAVMFERRTRPDHTAEDPIEDHLMDLMDRLTGWCAPRPPLSPTGPPFAWR